MDGANGEQKKLCAILNEMNEEKETIMANFYCVSNELAIDPLT